VADYLVRCALDPAARLQGTNRDGAWGRLTTGRAVERQ
jgi:hypothetical protein